MASIVDELEPIFNQLKILCRDVQKKVLTFEGKCEVRV